jgi:hypothetical protein
VTVKYSPLNSASRVLLIVGTILLLASWPLAVVVLLRGNALGLAIALFGAGLQGPFLAGYALARAERKQRWRWLAMASGGLGILLFSLVDAVNLDLDGFFELLILGTAGAAIGHLWPNSVRMGVLACDGVRASSRRQGFGQAHGCLGLDTACRCGYQSCRRSSVRAGF